MTKHQHYNLSFKKETKNNYTEFKCVDVSVNKDYFSLAYKLSTMHLTECKYLVSEITTAENGEQYEEYFAIDNDAASDDDEIRLSPPYVFIDNQVRIPFHDIKEILKEWITFIS